MTRFSKLDRDLGRIPEPSAAELEVRKKYRSPWTGKLWDFENNCTRNVDGDTPVFPHTGVVQDLEVMLPREAQVDLDTAPLEYLQYLASLEDQVRESREQVGHVLDFETGRRVA